MFRTNYPDTSFSLWSGFCYRFMVDDKELLYSVSAWTGKEFILYDGEEILSTRSYKKKTSHNFSINNVSYELTQTMDSWVDGGWHCCLFRENRIVKCFNWYLKKYSFLEKLLYGGIFAFLLASVPKSLWLILIPLIGAAILKLVIRSLVCKVSLGN